jgi:trimeric autotransporter adhesin
MKTRNFIFITILCLFWVKSLGQLNTRLGDNSFTGTNPKGITAIGSNAGQNIDPAAYPYPSPNQSFGFSNTYIGNNSGKGVSTTLNTGFSNTFVGVASGLNISSGSNNVFLGISSGENFTSGIENVFIGSVAGKGFANTTTSNNVFIGNSAGLSIGSGGGNTYVGSFSGSGGGPNQIANTTPTTGSGNCFFGQKSGVSNTTGSRNIYFGSLCAQNMITGSGNTFIGRVDLTSTLSPDINLTPGNNTSNTIILADGAVGTNNAGNQRLYIHSNGFTGIGLGNNVIPKSMLEVKGSALTPAPSGLRLSNLSNANFNTATPTSNRRVLTVNTLGDVILVDDVVGTGAGANITQSCATANYLPVNGASAGTLGCSQIFDNNTSVGIGTSSGFGYTYVAGDFTAGTVQLSGTVKLDVAGVTRSTGFYATSDKKFKKDIKTIDNSLEKIMALEGKTYNWRKDEFKDKNFSNELQYGLLAQEVQKVIPSLVIQSDNGDLAMNYIGLIPVLIEAMKEQQAQINDLKQQASDNFKAQNQDLLQFANTKIINVSPNPSSDMISVSLNIDKAIANANLQVHDINGTLLSNLSLKERDTNVIKTLQKDNFGKGIYIVSLIVNGKSIDTKKIVFN